MRKITLILHQVLFRSIDFAVKYWHSRYFTSTEANTEIPGKNERGDKRGVTEPNAECDQFEYTWHSSKQMPSGQLSLESRLELWIGDLAIRWPSMPKKRRNSLRLNLERHVPRKVKRQKMT